MAVAGHQRCEDSAQTIEDKKIKKIKYGSCNGLKLNATQYIPTLNHFASPMIQGPLQNRKNTQRKKAL